MNKLRQSIDFLKSQIKDPKKGLPKDIFILISQLTPLVNVDLLIKDEEGRTLLAWRDDIYDGAGWHIPGGIIRFRETLETRIVQVAKTEIGAAVKFDPKPIAVNQIIFKRSVRAHFISFLYRCFLSEKFIPKNTGLKKTDNGYLKWHRSCPKNLIGVQQQIYQNFI